MNSRRAGLIFSILFFLPLSPSLRAQEYERQMAHHAVYFEFLGQGGLYSIDYDFRLARHWSLRGGFTQWTMPSLFIFVEGEMEFTGFPLMVNFLVGGGDAYCEIGLGAVPARLRVTGEMMFLGARIEGEETRVLGTATLGFRYQPWRGGLVFRLGLTPLTNFKEVALSGGVSIGYSF